MSKRFTDTSLWSKPWFMELTPAEKLAWFYVKDQCDNVGVWTPNFRLAEFIIGTQIDWQKFADKCNGNIFVMENGKWWLVDFCSFQHPDLNPDSSSKPIQSYIKLLQEQDLWDFDIGSPKGMDTLSIGYKERERERVKEQEREPKKPKRKAKTITHPTLGLPMQEGNYKGLCEKYGEDVAMDYMQRAKAYADSHGRPYVDYAAAARTYILNDEKRGEKIGGGKKPPGEDILEWLKRRGA